MLHLVGWFIWIVWWCTELQTLNWRDYLEDLGVDGRILLKWIFTKLYEGQTGKSWLKIGTGGGLLWCGNGRPGSIKCGEFLDYVKTCYLQKKNSASWSSTLLTSHVHQQKSQNGGRYTPAECCVQNVRKIVLVFLSSTTPHKRKTICLFLFQDFRKKIWKVSRLRPFFYCEMEYWPLWNDTVTTEVMGKNLTQCHIVD